MVFPVFENPKIKPWIKTKKKNVTGVCQAAVSQRKTLIVSDVDAFPGHIACDGRAKSEIVLPVFDREGIIRGVLDVDSRSLDSFDEVDAAELEKIVRLVYFPEG